MRARFLAVGLALALAGCGDGFGPIQIHDSGENTRTTLELIR
jgi:hypothetical protein